MGQPIPSYRPKRAGKRVESRLYDRTKRKADHDKIGNTKFTSSRLWRRFRADFLNQHPLCRDCQESGRLTPATEVHHVVKRSDSVEGWFDESNCMPLCRPCHTRRTNRGE